MRGRRRGTSELFDKRALGAAFVGPLSNQSVLVNRASIPRSEVPVIDKCVFCGGQPTNWEHVWPRWSHHFIPKGKNKWTSLHAVEYEDRSTFEIRHHAGDPHDWQVKCVDEKCNNGWMKAREDELRPLFIRMHKATPEYPIRLTEADQLTIARWFAIKAVVQEYSQKSSRVSHYRQRVRLAQKGKLPEKAWRIWIGVYEGSDPISLWTSFPFQLIPEAVKRRRKTAAVTYYNSQIASYVLAKFFILILRSPHEFFVTRWRYPAAAGISVRFGLLAGTVFRGL